MSPPHQFQTEAGTEIVWLHLNRDMGFTQVAYLVGIGWMYVKPSVLSAFQTWSRQRIAPQNWESGTGENLNFHTCDVSVRF